MPTRVMQPCAVKRLKSAQAKQQMGLIDVPYVFAPDVATAYLPAGIESMTLFTPGRMRTERSTPAASISHALSCRRFCLSSSFSPMNSGDSSSSSKVATRMVSCSGTAVMARALLRRVTNDGRRAPAAPNEPNEDEREEAADESEGVDMPLLPDTGESMGVFSTEPGPCMWYASAK